VGFTPIPLLTGPAFPPPGTTTTIVGYGEKGMEVGAWKCILDSENRRVGNQLSSGTPWRGCIWGLRAPTKPQRLWEIQGSPLLFNNNGLLQVAGVLGQIAR
jgi:hypothetical protein